MAVYVRDLEPKNFYRTDRGGSARWFILDKTPVLNGFKVTYIDAANLNNPAIAPWVTVEDPLNPWPVILDKYLIPEMP